MSDTQELKVSTTLEGRVLHKTAEHNLNNILILALHGYGESADIMMDRLDPWIDSGFTLACPQALHPIYLPNRKVGHSWMTSYCREEAIVENMKYLEIVIDHLRKDRSFSKLIVLGYSQGAQMAMRVVRWITGDHLISLCGELPPELRKAPLYGKERQPESLILARGKKDLALSAETMAENRQVWEEWEVPCATLELPGAHHWQEDWTDQLSSCLPQNG